MPLILGNQYSDNNLDLSSLITNLLQLELSENNPVTTEIINNYIYYEHHSDPYSISDTIIDPYPISDADSSYDSDSDSLYDSMPPLICDETILQMPILMNATIP